MRLLKIPLCALVALNTTLWLSCGFHPDSALPHEPPPQPPQITALSPVSAAAGADGFVLHILGEHFDPSSTVTWNGSPRTTTFVAASALEINVTMEDMSVPGNISISVKSPTLPAAAATFVIGPPATPVISSIAPNLVQVGDGDTILTVQGTGFTRSSRIQFASLARTTTYVSNKQLQTKLLASELVKGGDQAVSVVTEDAVGGTTSSSQVLRIQYARPVITALTPNQGLLTSGPFPFTVNGSGFGNGAAVLWNSLPQPTTFVSSSRLDVTVPSGTSLRDMFNGLSAQITVQNPVPNDGSSSATTFTVLLPTPTVTKVSAFTHAGVAMSLSSFISQEYAFIKAEGTGFTKWSRFVDDIDYPVGSNHYLSETNLETEARFQNVGEHRLWVRNGYDASAPKSALPFTVMVQPAGPGVTSTRLPMSDFWGTSSNLRFVSAYSSGLDHAYDTCLDAAGCTAGWNLHGADAISDGGEYVVYASHEYATNFASAQPGSATPQPHTSNPAFPCSVIWRRTCYMSTLSCQKGGMFLYGVDQSYGMPIVEAMTPDGRFVLFRDDNYPSSWLILSDTCAGAPAECKYSQAKLAYGNRFLPSQHAMTPDARYVLFFNSGNALVRTDTCVSATTPCAPATEAVGIQFQENPGRIAISANGRYVLGPSATVVDTCLNSSPCSPSRFVAIEERFEPVSMDLSGDGRYVLFIVADIYNEGVGEHDTNNVADLFVTDTCAGVTDNCTVTTRRVSLTPAGEQLKWGVKDARISRDGRFVLYSYGASAGVNLAVNPFFAQ